MKAKRCPFCNSHNLQITCNEVIYWVYCLNCRAEGPSGYGKRSAVELWNGKHKDSNPSALVANRKSNHHEMKEIE